MRLTTTSWWSTTPPLASSPSRIDGKASTASMSAMSSGLRGSVMSKMSMSVNSTLSVATRKARGPSCHAKTEW